MQSVEGSIAGRRGRQRCSCLRPNNPRPEPAWRRSGCDCRIGTCSASRASYQEPALLSLALPGATTVVVTTETGIHVAACSAETWTFDGTDWRLEHPSTPLPASIAILIAEPKTGAVVAVLAPRSAAGGSGFEGADCAAGTSAGRSLPLSSSWRWTGTTWIQVSTGTEPGGANLGISPDGATLGLVSVAGTTMVATENAEQLWDWNGARWTEIPGSSLGPPPGSYSRQSIDGEGHVVVFGGVTEPNGPQNADTWVWDGSRWHNVATAGRLLPKSQPQPATQNADAATPAALP
jgi:hypothetical protein